MVLSRMERLNSSSIRGRTLQIRIGFLTDLDSGLAVEPSAVQRSAENIQSSVYSGSPAGGYGGQTAGVQRGQIRHSTLALHASFMHSHCIRKFS